MMQYSMACSVHGPAGFIPTPYALHCPAQPSLSSPETLVNHLLAMSAYTNIHPEPQSNGDSDAHWLEGAKKAFVSSQTGSNTRPAHSGSNGTASTIGGKDAAEALFQDEDVCPPEHDHRTLVLCFDGTGDQYDTDNSSIVQFFSMLKKDDRKQQMVYYQAGIGTYTIPQVATPLYAKWSKTIDMMIGVHLNAHVMGGYEFLMENYEAGDKICIFGFSRGAYTARALAGMIQKVGLLPASNHQQVPFAYKMYSDDTEIGWKQSTTFKKAFSMDVDIEFLGTWDTVSSVGIIPRYLPFVKSNTHVRYFRHALSLDERRARFKPNVWARPSPEEHALGVQKGEMPRSEPKHPERKKSQHDPKKQQLRELKRRYSAMDEPTDVEEVWFAGCHCDVGGGSVVNGTRNVLARIPLRWMIRQCFALKTGIMFHTGFFRDIGLDINTLYPEVKARPPPLQLSDLTAARRAELYGTMKQQAAGDGIGVLLPEVQDFVSEEEEDLRDALSPIYDQLTLNKAWWFLEVLPQKQKYQKDDESLARALSINMGKGRVIPHQKKNGVKVHRSVHLRMQADQLFGPNGEELGKYIPLAKIKVEPTWVD